MPPVHPCGYAVDLLRAPYTTLMAFYEDQEALTEVYWYPVSESRPWLPYFTPFHSAEWDEDNPIFTRNPGGYGLGERLEGDRKRPTRTRPTSVTFRGQFCGTKEQWERGDSLSIVPRPGNPLRFPACCGPESTPFPQFPSCPDAAFLAGMIQDLYRRTLTADEFAAKAGAYFEGPATIRVWGPVPGPTSPAFAVVSFDDWDLVIITGTTEFEHWIRQTLRAGAVFRFSCADGTRYMTHDLYQQAATLIENHLFLTGSHSRPLLIAGHSMGGAVGNILTIRATHGLPSRECAIYTFGCPRCFDDSGRDAYTNARNRFCNIANLQDVVPLLPPHFNAIGLAGLRGIARHVFLEMYWANLPGWYLMDEQGRFRSAQAGTIPGAILGGITDTVMRGVPFRPDRNHFLEEYIRRLSLGRCFEQIGANPSPTPQAPDLWLRASDFPAGAINPNWPAGPGSPIAANYTSGTIATRDEDAVEPAVAFVHFGGPPSSSNPVYTFDQQFQAADDFTLFVKVAPWQFERGFLLTSFGTSSSPRVYFDDGQYGYANTGVAFDLHSIEPIPRDTFSVISLQRTDGVWSLRRNGDLVAESLGPGGFFVLNQLRLGFDNGDHGSLDVAEIIGFARPISQAEYNATLAQLSSNTRNNMQTGMIAWFPLSTAMDGWLLCDGDQFAQDAFPGLYAYLGDSFNNSREALDPDPGYFRVPNLIGLSLIGAGGAQLNPTTAAKVGGNTYGEEEVTLDETQIPAHNHTLHDPLHAHATTGFTPPTVIAFNKGAATGLVNAGFTVGGQAQAWSVGIQNAATGITLDPAGGGGPHNNLPPCIALYPFIKT